MVKGQGKYMGKTNSSIRRIFDLLGMESDHLELG